MIKWIKDMFFNPNYPTDSFEYAIFSWLCAAAVSVVVILGVVVYWTTR